MSQCDQGARLYSLILSCCIGVVGATIGSVDDRDRFLSHTRADGACRVWTGAVSKTGRGQFKVDGATYDAPRLAWCEENGPVPKGRMVKHRCGRPECVLPAHLVVCSPSEDPNFMSDIDLETSDRFVRSLRFRRALSG
jgi:hypothetical protein